MDRLTEKQAKQILFNAQTAAYPNRNVPELLAPLYRYIEQTEAQLAELKEVYIDDRGEEWDRPTAEAYYRACRARDKWQSQAEQAQADNAALVKELLHIGSIARDADEGILVGNYYLVIETHIKNCIQKCSGAALLQELGQLRTIRNVAEELIQDARIKNEVEIYAGGTITHYRAFISTESLEALRQALAQAKTGGE